MKRDLSTPLSPTFPSSTKGNPLKPIKPISAKPLGMTGRRLTKKQEADLAFKTANTSAAYNYANDNLGGAMNRYKLGEEFAADQAKSVATNDPKKMRNPNQGKQVSKSASVLPTTTTSKRSERNARRKNRRNSRK